MPGAVGRAERLEIVVPPHRHHQQRHARIRHRDVGVLAHSGSLARLKGREHRDRRVAAREDIGNLKPRHRGPGLSVKPGKRSGQGERGGIVTGALE
jgi:hypothetical protein